LNTLHLKQTLRNKTNQQMAFVSFPRPFGYGFANAYNHESLFNDDFGSFFRTPSPWESSRHRCGVHSGGCPSRRRANISVARPSLMDFFGAVPRLDDFWNRYGDDEDYEDDVKQIESNSEKMEVSSPETKAIVHPTSRALGSVAKRSGDNGSTEYEISLPGLTRDDVSLDFDFKKHTLTLKANKKSSEKHEDEHGKRSTVRHISIVRSLPIPESTKPEDVRADFIDGSLHISVATKSIEAPKESTTEAASEPEAVPAAVPTPSSELESSSVSEDSNTATVEDAE